MECSVVWERVYSRRLEEDQRRCILRPGTAIVRRSTIWHRYQFPFGKPFREWTTILGNHFGKCERPLAKGTWSIFSTLTLEQRKFAEGPTAKIWFQTARSLGLVRPRLKFKPIYAIQNGGLTSCMGNDEEVRAPLKVFINCSFGNQNENVGRAVGRRLIALVKWIRGRARMFYLWKTSMQLVSPGPCRNKQLCIYYS